MAKNRLKVLKHSYPIFQKTPVHRRLKNLIFGHFWALAENSYIFMIAGLEPKLFILKSSTQQQSYRAHTIGQFCHQDRPSICLCSKVRDCVMTAFQLAPKWSKVAVIGCCKFGSFQPNLTHRKPEWSNMMFIESPFRGYPTCLLLN